MKPQRVLFFYQHFWPDSPPYASMLRSIGKRLVSESTSVDILTAQPSYKSSDFAKYSSPFESVDAIGVRRLSLLPGSEKSRLIALLGKVLFPLRAMIAVIMLRFRGNAPTVVVAATIPPVLNGVFGLIAARMVGAKFVYHLQDIYPEIGAAGALWSRDSLRYKALARIDTVITRRADACVVLSYDMHNSLMARGVSERSIHIINNFMLEDFTAKFAQDEIFSPEQLSVDLNSDSLTIGEESQCFKLVFAGNLGRFQALDCILKAFLDPSVECLPFELHFLGTGAAVDELKAMAHGANKVFFHGHQPFDLACQLITQCDVGIVSISEGIIRYAYPSKTLTYLGLGVPLFALVESDSQLAVEVTRDDLGVVCGDASRRTLVNGYCELASWLSHERHHKQRNQERLRDYAKECGSADWAAEKWTLLLTELEPS